MAWRKDGWLGRWLLRREIDRPIPRHFSWYMTADEKRRWAQEGWRVTYWVCPQCGVRRGDSRPEPCPSHGPVGTPYPSG